MKSIRYSRFGEPADVAELHDEPDAAAPSATQVQVRHEAMVIHPADLLRMEGRYGARRPPLPADGGTDGVGRVVAVGADVKHLRAGDLVPLVFTGVPAWREGCTVDATRLFALPEGDPQVLSVVGVNALTAWAMLHESIELPAGGWVIQNAAASSVGLATMQLGQRAGYRVINVVRSASAEARLRAAGALHVLLDGDDLAARVATLTDGNLPRLAIDAVSGSATERLGACVAPGGLVLNYGLLSGDPATLSSTDLLFREVSLRGFWLRAWLRDTDMAKVRDIYNRLAAMALAGELPVPVAATYSLSAFRAALVHAAGHAREGKILFIGEGGGGGAVSSSLRTRRDTAGAE